ncbi:uncharacterized protein LOC101851962 [Aplysia californica]|uniref:Uncharacterized protein LOC101851962 n=1 Tax=Aplysia californica TaxID=6500 RepID=A0ABM0JUQ2_APLCA|nr:uncharacterized protein LOC101851962 [Aplysia californica]
MLRTRSFDLVNRTIENHNDKLPRLKGSVGAELQHLAQDRAIPSAPDESRRRRTIRLVRHQNSWGFTLQTYGVRNKRTREVEVMSYVDYVEINGAAWVAGMRRGDIILSVNGESVESSTHAELVKRIQQSGPDMRLVVLFEDCCKKVELHERYLKLKKMLSHKIKELHRLEEEERRINKGIPLSRTEILRRSTCSSTSSEWDIYSELTSPAAIDNVPANQFVFKENLHLSVSDVSSGSPPPVVKNTAFTSGEMQDSNGVPETGPIPSPAVLQLKEENGDPQDFVLSENSENSQSSETGYRELYNITRCAQCINDVSRCTHKRESISVNMDEKVDSADSLTNLVKKSGKELKKVGLSDKYLKSSPIGEKSDERFPKRMNAFYIESDSEESQISASDLDRSRPGQMSFSSGTSISAASSISGISVRSSGSSATSSSVDSSTLFGGSKVGRAGTLIDTDSNSEHRHKENNSDEKSYSLIVYPNSGDSGLVDGEDKHVNGDGWHELCSENKSDIAQDRSGSQTLNSASRGGPQSNISDSECVPKAEDSDIRTVQHEQLASLSQSHEKHSADENEISQSAATSNKTVTILLEREKVTETAGLSLNEEKIIVTQDKKIISDPCEKDTESGQCEEQIEKGSVVCPDEGQLCPQTEDDYTDKNQGIEHIEKDSQGQVSSKSTSSRRRFMYGILVNDEDQSTSL